VEVIASTTRDVTARKRAEEAQRELAERLRMALDAARLGWWQYDGRTGQVFCDERMRAMYALEEGVQDLGTMRARVHPDDKPAIENAFRVATDPNIAEPYAVEFRLLLPDGSTRWVASKGQATFEGEGEERRVAIFVGAALDITEAKNAAEGDQPVPPSTH
jgi:PAS domain S-box-containing protein